MSQPLEAAALFSFFAMRDLVRFALLRWMTRLTAALSRTEATARRPSTLVSGAAPSYCLTVDLILDLAARLRRL